MKILFVHAHFDDYEFTASGLFELWRRRLGDDLSARVLVCTDGRAGHHLLSPEKTTEVRIAEQEASARIGKYDFQCLRLPDGRIPREACLLVSRDLLAALWRAIRDFEPDYLFCPPLPVDPLAGIHVDHVSVAEAVRKVAYMINVPHAFLEEFPPEEQEPQSCKVPVILNTYDAYMAGANHPDFLVDVEEAFESICEMTWCHQSQIKEWLPWVGRHKLDVPQSFDDWKKMLRKRFSRQNKELGLEGDRAMEAFLITAWGEVPNKNQILRDFPGMDLALSQFENLSRFALAHHND
ncbi:MAG: PIG-L family deacetylase [Verrucomicrobia bacterium]|jgi:LmbE family N-acetylglucosaminyl deacetylase|nr:PIG-L family deacetylase [Verrucomicrobiota bacterium]